LWREGMGYSVGRGKGRNSTGGCLPALVCGPNGQEVTDADAMDCFAFHAFVLESGMLLRRQAREFS
jgi:hypothetical protein